MSEWLPVPRNIGNSLDDSSLESNINVNKNIVSRLGHKIVGIFRNKSDNFNSQEGVYSYFNRISGGDDEHYNALVNCFNESVESSGFDASVQDILDSILAGDLPKPNGFLNAMALPNDPALISNERYLDDIN
jgi:hypothetical protein